MHVIHLISDERLKKGHIGVGTETLDILHEQYVDEDGRITDEGIAWLEEKRVSNVRLPDSSEKPATQRIDL
jgi:hypothetical protein